MLCCKCIISTYIYLFLKPYTDFSEMQPKSKTISLFYRSPRTRLSELSEYI